MAQTNAVRTANDVHAQFLVLWYGRGPGTRIEHCIARVGGSRHAQVPQIVIPIIWQPAVKDLLPLLVALHQLILLHEEEGEWATCAALRCRLYLPLLLLLLCHQLVLSIRPAILGGTFVIVTVHKRVRYGALLVYERPAPATHGERCASDRPVDKRASRLAGMQLVAALYDAADVELVR